MTLEDYLKQDAERYPDKVAVICGNERLTYAQLWQRVREKADEFSASEALRCIPFKAVQTTDFLITYLSIHLAGRVAVPLEKNIPESRYNEITERLTAC